MAINQKIKRTWNTVTTILVAVLVLFAGLLWGVRLVGVNIFIVQSGSMEPEIATGSVVYVRTVDAAELEVGDVITFQLNGDLRATHRIIEVTAFEGEVAFRTKGDANDHADNGLVPPSAIVGKVMFSIPYLGYLTAYIQQPPGLYIAVCVAAAVLLLTVLPEIIFSDGKVVNKQEEEQS